jgi:MoaA/NifB/PqqE/SkfB family radical SAM enzyme
MRKQADADNSLIAKLGRRLWLLKAGLDRPEYWSNRIRENMAGCAYPGTTLLIRPNGAVLPCPFWEQQPLGVVPADQPGPLLRGQQLTDIRDGLKSGDCIGSCVDCDHRRDALYRPFRKSVPLPAPERDG